MTDPTLSIQELREDVVNYRDIELLETTAGEIIDRLEVAESRNEDGAKQVDELQDLVIALSDQVIELGGKPTTEFTHIEAAHALLTAAEARVKELESTQQPRAMAGAPRDTDIMLTIGARYRGDEDEPFRMGLLGWLPLPDQSEVKS